MTAETALAMPAVVVLIALVATVGQVVVAQVRCTDAARAAARLAARGESPQRVLAAGRDAAPEAARVSVSRGTSTVEVRVTARVGLPLPALGQALTVAGTAVADVEEP